MKLSITILSCLTATAVAFTPSSFVGSPMVRVPSSSSTTTLSMKYKVAVVGGGPSGACAAEIFAQEKNIDTVFFERKMDNAKPCGGAIPLCMIGEFDLPETVVDRKVRPVIRHLRCCVCNAPSVCRSLVESIAHFINLTTIIPAGPSNESHLTIGSGSIHR